MRSLTSKPARSDHDPRPAIRERAKAEGFETVGFADARAPQGRKLFREVIPLVVSSAVEGDRAGYSLLATLEMKRAGASGLATQEVRVELPVER